ncbi:hypothetical protein Q3G72_008880 [Acer saccharum]|nr:hypothetical protein Q3G72_008880 [Acer saccharum]
MATVTKLSGFLHLLLFLPFHLLIDSASAAYPIGVNYGTVANNLPPPQQVAKFLKTQTSIHSVKIFDANPDILRAFANTNISVTVTVGNGDIPALAKLPAAQSWIANNILPHQPQTIIRYIVLGNEILATSDKTLVAHLLPAMKTLKYALDQAKLTHIQVSTPNSLGILSTSEPPSNGRFRKGYDKAVFAKILDFHRQTKSPFMVNPYPYFGFVPQTLNYALFKPNGGVFDAATGMNYTNMFDAQLDAVYSAMKKLGYEDVDIVVGETGWPSAGDPNQPDSNLLNAQSYNGNLVQHVSSGKGTPLMPNRTFETYIFALFNENLKPSISEQNFGLFKPDFSPVYSVDVLNHKPASGPTTTPGSSPPALAPDRPAPGPVRPAPGPARPAPGPGSVTGRWCVPKPGTSNAALQANIDYVCGTGLDCKPIQQGGSCFDPNDVRSHAAYAMDAFYQANGHHDYNCDFNKTGLIVHSDPSHGACNFSVEGDSQRLEKSESLAAESGRWTVLWTVLVMIVVVLVI